MAETIAETDTKRSKLFGKMEKEQFDDICSRLNIDETSKRSAIQQFEEISRNTILDVSISCLMEGACSFFDIIQ